MATGDVAEGDDNPVVLHVDREAYTAAARELEGLARDGTDVYELAQRLKLSEYFHDVQLLPGKKENNADKLELVSFALQLKVRY